MTKSRVIVICLLIFLIIGGYIYYQFFINTGKPLNISNSTTLESVKDLHQLEEEANQLIYQPEDEDNLGHSSDSQEETISTQLNLSENVITLLGESIQTKDVTFFSKAFESNQFSKDLFVVETESIDKTPVIEEMITQISRNNKLQDISIIHESTNMVKGKHDIKVAFIYTDGKTARIALHLLKTGGHSAEDSILYITNSVWDLIDEINKQTK